jgi:hypothetical protein
MEARIYRAADRGFSAVVRVSPLLAGEGPGVRAAGIAAVSKRIAMLAACLFLFMGAQQRSANFIVETPDPNFARQVAQTAETLRRDLAVEWLGQTMPNWSQPCVMTVQPGGGAGGQTTFVFDRGEVFGWRMSIQGSPQRILDSVLPHEITHMIFASHFRQPVPRWADEGGATSVEHASEKNKHRQMLDQFLRTGRGIAFSQMFAMTEYPADIMPLYAEGYSLAEFLIQTGGRRKYVEFLGDGIQSDDWSGAVERNYSLQDLSVLQNTWLAWVRHGAPLMPRRPATNVILASHERRPRPEPNLIYHVPSKPATATPLADLVPVRFPADSKEAKAMAQNSSRPLEDGSPAQNSPRLSEEGPGGRAAIAAAPIRTTVPASKWLDPTRVTSPPADRVAAVRPRAIAPVSRWHVPGAPETDPSPTQVTHPQPLEQPRQTVLQ